jgi:DNA repair exonuclease SbcCD ATPase subunit
MSGHGDMAGAAVSSGPEEALAELGRAVTRAAVALTAIPGDDDTTAYECAKALDVAFGDLTELLRTVPEIVGLGAPGRTVSERLEQRAAELAARHGEVAAYRERLDKLAETEQDLAKSAAEADRLRARVSNLERAERLASEIPGLRVTVNALEEKVAAAEVADAPEIGIRIAEAAERFAALTERQRDVIGEAADKLVADADAAIKELGEQRARRDAAAADLARHESDAAQLAADYNEQLPVLTNWSKADADLADSLRAAGLGTGASALESVEAELSGISQRLTDLDNSLRSLLADHTKAYEDARQVRPF